MLFPSSVTEPALGFINPPRHFRSVDFPDPEGPTTATASPSFMLMYKPRKATTFPSSALDSYTWYNPSASRILFFVELSDMLHSPLRTLARSALSARRVVTTSARTTAPNTESVTNPS